MLPQGLRRPKEVSWPEEPEVLPHKARPTQRAAPRAPDAGASQSQQSDDSIDVDKDLLILLPVRVMNARAPTNG